MPPFCLEKSAPDAHVMKKKNATKTGIINSRKVTQRKMDKLPFTAWFVSLVFFMRSCKIANIRRKPICDTAPAVSDCVGSPRPTQFERVNCRVDKDLCISHLPVMVWVAVSGRRNSKQHRQDSGTYLEESMMVLRERKKNKKEKSAYWAVQRSWFARVNTLRNLSGKKSRKSSFHFRADFWVGVG